jgi:ATP-dependent Clp protease ATP-binding subunit ClpA
VLELYSDRACRVVELAVDQAGLLGHRHVGTEHLLLGILVDGETPAAAALVAHGATVDAVRDKVAEAVGRKEQDGSGTELPFTTRAKRAIERATRLSLKRKEPHVEAAHVLLSVLDVEGTAGQVLRGLGVDLSNLRDALEQRWTAADPKAGSAPAERSVPCCPVCGTALEVALAQRVMRARGAGKAGREFVVGYCSACGAALGVTPV